MADVTMPQLGETVTEGTITQWFKAVGDEVAMDEILFEISTDKVDSEVPSPVAGVLSEILAQEGDVVEVGQVLARIGDAGSAPAAAAAPEPAAAPGVEEVPAAEVAPPPPPPPPPPVEPAPARAAAPEPAPAPAPAPEPVAAPSAAADASGLVLSPVVRRLISDNNLDAGSIVGSGIGGRVTRSDVERAILEGTATTAGAPPAAAPDTAAPTPAPAPAPAPAATPASAPVAHVPAVGARDQIVPLNNIRKRTAEHMVMSTQTAPHVLTAMEVDYERVEHVRRAIKSGWKADEGFSLTYLPFIARAVVDALREYPHLNASFGGDHLVVHDDVNLAIAVDIDFNGLLAPVVKSVDGKRLRQIARDIVDVASRARTKQLRPDDLSGGTFTLTNPGQYGTLMQFPIINQPQVAILSTDGVQRKPVVVTDDYGNESIAIHSVGVLALAWDHRAFDGAYAAAFMHRVKEIIETRDWEAEVR
jgi:pyruvate dehydrogenase E2 component (dihydrolipoamide acetyltransferase)